MDSGFVGFRNNVAGFKLVADLCAYAYVPFFLGVKRRNVHSALDKRTALLFHNKERTLNTVEN